jgi:hypothetical protein
MQVGCASARPPNCVVRVFRRVMPFLSALARFVTWGRDYYENSIHVVGSIHVKELCSSFVTSASFQERLEWGELFSYNNFPCFLACLISEREFIELSAETEDA